VRRLAVILLACGAAWGAEYAVEYAAPFSHKVHLGLDLQCATCHTAAAASTKASDNLLPAKTVCLQCHEDAQIPAPPQTRVAFFSHAQHLKMGNMAPIIAAAIDKKTYLQPPGDIRRHLNTQNACEACHRGLRESDQVTPAAMPQMADCLVCHTEIDNPFSCEKCHAKDAKLKPASHVPSYLSDHTSGKLNLDKASCVVCHGRNFRCLGCH
jgi:predicted CXXCH cytochrome family protein